MTQDKKDFIETMLTWFRSPKVGKDEELDRRFLASAYDNITQPHWISVEDELPPIFPLNPNESMNVITYGLHTMVNWYDYERGEWVRDSEITHWMPLPSIEGLKEGGEE